MNKNPGRWRPQWVWLRLGAEIRMDKHPEEMVRDKDWRDSIRKNGIIIGGHSCIPSVTAREELGLEDKEYDYEIQPVKLVVAEMKSPGRKGIY